MKKFTVLGAAVTLALFSVFSCAKKPAAPAAGTASAEDMLQLLPKDAQIVFLMDLHKAMTIETVDNAIKESPEYGKFQEFVEISGIDPQKDVFFLAGAVSGDMGGKDQEGVGILNLKYTKETIIPLIKEKAPEMSEEDYNGIMIYLPEKEGKEEGAFAFLDDSNIAIGNIKPLKAAIDVFQKKGENVFKNEALSALLAKTDKSAMFWAAILIPAEAMSKAAMSNPMLSNLESINAAILSFDYKNKNILGEIRVMSSDKANNEQIAQALNGFKALGGMLAAEKPEIGELMERIEISSTADHVKISASLPEDLINKLKSKKEEEEKENEK